MHARIQIYWCRSSIFRHLKLELLTQFPALNDEKYINVVYIWRKFVSFYGYVHWRMTTEISVMYGSEKVKSNQWWMQHIFWHWLQSLIVAGSFGFLYNVLPCVTDMCPTSENFPTWYEGLWKVEPNISIWDFNISMVHPFIHFGGNHKIFVWKLVFKFLLAKYIPIGSIRLVWQNLNFEGKLENKND